MIIMFVFVHVYIFVVLSFCLYYMYCDLFLYALHLYEEIKNIIVFIMNNKFL